MRIRCHNLSIRAPDGKALLSDVSLSVDHGEFVAVIGPSGAGKTTLLKGLAGVLPAGRGTVHYDDIPAEEYRRRYGGQVGYVPQDDIVPTELTVERALYYSARLRLPGDTTEGAVRARVGAVMTELRMTDRKTIPVRNLSGGQRKRVSIGAELLARPRVLFLDEPTAGLDVALESRLIDDFARQSGDEGRTIIMVTHAAQAVANRCTRLVVLARSKTKGGYLVYDGAPAEVLNCLGVTDWTALYEKLDLPDCVRPSRTDQQDRPLPPGHMPGPPDAARPASPLAQCWVLTQRYAETIWNDGPYLVLLSFLPVIVAVMIGNLFPQKIFTIALTPDPPGDQAAAKRVLFLLALVSVWFGTSNAAPAIVKEAAVYARERHAGLRLRAYIASKMAILAGLGGVQSIALLGVLLWLGVGRTAALLLYASLVLGSVAGAGMGLIISAVARNADRASVLVPLILIPQVLFAGVLTSIDRASIAARISDFMVVRWVYLAMGAILEVDSVKQPQPPMPPAEFGRAPSYYLITVVLFIILAVLLLACVQWSKAPRD